MSRSCKCAAVSLLILGLVPTAWAQQNKADAYGQAIQEVLRIQQRLEEEERRKALAQERLRVERARAEEAEARRAEAQARAEAQQRRTSAAAKAPTATTASTTAGAGAPSARHVGRLVIPIAALKGPLMAPVNLPPDLSFDGSVQIAPNEKWAAGTDNNGRAKLWSLPALQPVEIDNSGGYDRVQFIGNDAVWFRSGYGASAQNLLISLPADGRPPARVQLPADANILNGVSQTSPVIYLSQPKSDKSCRTVLAIDPSSGQLIQQMAVPVPAAECRARLGGQILEVLASNAERKRHWLLRDGREVGQVQTSEWYISLPWIGDYVGVNEGDSSKYVSLIPGRSTCTLPPDTVLIATESLQLGERGVLMNAYNKPATTPAFFDVSRCSAEWRGSPGQHLMRVEADQWALVRDATGEIDLLVGEGPAVKQRITMPPTPPSSGKHFGPRYSVRGYSKGRIGVIDTHLEPARTTLFDAAGALIGSVSGFLDKGGNWSVALTNVSSDPTKIQWKSEVRRADVAMASMRNRAAVVALLTRDEYESTEAWRQRLEAANVSQEFQVTLGPYDPDTGRFPQANFNDAVLDLRMPPDVARQLRGQTTASVRGRLRAVDSSSIELVGPEIVRSDGSRLSLLSTPAASCAADLASLAPSMRAYTHPRLAGVRAQILATRIDNTLDKAQAQGFTPAAALAAIRRQSQIYAQEAQQILDEVEPRGRVDLQRAVNDTLALGYNCDAAGGQQVCRFLERAWQAQASREVAKALDCLI